jgi:diketogulonate reductase-like aldo/keto reductase
MEITPFNQALEISEFCHDNAIVLLSDNPLAKDIYSDSPNLIQIAESLNITVQQVNHSEISSPPNAVPRCW